MTTLFLIVIFLPILGGIGIKFIKKKQLRELLTLALLIVNGALVWFMLFNCRELTLTLFNITDKLSFSFRIDGAGAVFAGLVSVLWIVATIYAFEYMEHERVKNNRTEKAVNVFFTYYTMTYGIVLGLAFSGNLLTMYLFFEMLSLITTPLVIFSLSEKAMKAGRKYLEYMLGGAAFGFIGMVALIYYGNSLDFVYGGSGFIAAAADKTNLLLLIYVFAFCGFAVKAAIFPFSRWLIYASVAPTPVTGLLHAAAVVKGGAFAVLRLTYYSFGADFLRGTWAQWVVMSLALITIVYGSTMAVKETHLKRRLAYSTISNLSYILFAITLMTPLGLYAALCHFVMHAVMKLCSFLCAGGLMQATEREYIYQFNGIAKKMKIICISFFVAGLSLIGIPPLAGFISKWNIAEAAIAYNKPLAYIGIAVVLYSALMTAIYMLTVLLKLFVKTKEEETVILTPIGFREKYAVLFLAIFVVILGCFSSPLTGWLMSVANGLK